MICGKMYDDTLLYFDKIDSDGLYPDTVLNIINDMGFSHKKIKKISDSGIALIALKWKDKKSGHFVVWDSNRKQFLDPKFGLVDRKDFTKFCKIDHIWIINDSSFE